MQPIDIAELSPMVRAALARAVTNDHPPLARRSTNAGWGMAEARPTVTAHYFNGVPNGSTVTWLGHLFHAGEAELACVHKRCDLVAAAVKRGDVTTLLRLDPMLFAVPALAGKSRGGSALIAHSRAWPRS